ncbi:hypothetical protein AU476_17775 [Cupriavidus sp. UYMSc13B]|nr:hypothetical protein AU476_17775 [Cupriavidus sp. UYMSc13B]
MGIDMMCICAKFDARPNKHVIADSNLCAIEDNASHVHEAAVAQLEVACLTSIEWASYCGLRMHTGESPSQNAVTMTSREQG